MRAGMRGGPYIRVVTSAKGAPLPPGVNPPYLLQVQKLKIDPEDPIRLDKSSPIWTRHVPGYVGKDALDMGDYCHRLAMYACLEEQRELARAPVRRDDPAGPEARWRTHLRVIVSVPPWMQPRNEEIWGMVEELVQERFPLARVIGVIHRDRGHVHAHLYILARQSDGPKIDLRGRDYTEIDEAWNRIYCAWSGYDPKVHLSKKKETRAFWRSVAKEMRRDQRQGRSRTLPQVIRDLGERPLRHEAYRTIPLRETRSISRLACDLERIHQELRALERGRSVRERRARQVLRARQTALRRTFLRCVARLAESGSPECREQVLRLVGPAEWRVVNQALRPQTGLAPEQRDIIAQLQTLHAGDLHQRLRGMMSQGAEPGLAQETFSLHSARDALAKAYEDPPEKAWSRFCDLAVLHGPRQAEEAVELDPTLLGALRRTEVRPWQRGVDPTMQAARVARTAVPLCGGAYDQAHWQLQRASTSAGGPRNHPVEQRWAIRRRIAALPHPARDELMTHLRIRMPGLLGLAEDILRGSERSTRDLGKVRDGAALVR